MKQYVIKVTVFLEKSFWIGLFERNDDQGFAVAKQIFGGEPTDAELYNFVITHFDELKFTQPQDFKLIVTRKNYKRTQREVRKEMQKIKFTTPKATFAQEVLRLDIEKNKKAKQVISKSKKEELAQRKFDLKQAKKKQKHRGH